MSQSDESDPHTSGSETADPETRSEHSDPGNEGYNSPTWSEEWAHPLRGEIDDHLEACYHAIFGVAAWDPAVAATLRRWPVFKREHFGPHTHVETLQDFYRDFCRVVDIFRQNNFILEYESAFMLKTGIRIDFLAPTSRPDHVITREALTRLYSLYHTITEHGPRVAAHDIAHWMHVHENDTSGLDAQSLTISNSTEDARPSTQSMPGSTRTRHTTGSETAPPPTKKTGRLRRRLAPPLHHPPPAGRLQHNHPHPQAHARHPTEEQHHARACPPPPSLLPCSRACKLCTTRIVFNLAFIQ